MALLSSILLPLHPAIAIATAITSTSMRPFMSNTSHIATTSSNSAGIVITTTTPARTTASTDTTTTTTTTT
eukprot:3003265-Pyramimonas_sp.AAC.1